MGGATLTAARAEERDRRGGEAEAAPGRRRTAAPTRADPDEQRGRPQPAFLREATSLASRKICLTDAAPGGQGCNRPERWRNSWRQWRNRWVRSGIWPCRAHGATLLQAPDGRGCRRGRGAPVVPRPRGCPSQCLDAGKEKPAGGDARRAGDDRRSVRSVLEQQLREKRPNAQQTHHPD